VRPLKLIVESFTCFKDRQAPLDFSELDLFAISGPTGAGKSSLLDAIIFALYGRVPRMRKGYSELISLGRDRMSVVLDFRMGQRSFRVTRTGRRGRSAEAQLDELLDGHERSIAGGVHSVDSEVVKLLGLRYEAFTQAVVLPQGDFARFLKSQPRERREILRDLLRLQVYERMRRRAAEQTKELEVQLRGINERLDQDYQEAKPDRLEELRRQVRTLAKRNRADSDALTSLEKKVQEIKIRCQKSRELQEKRARLLELTKKETKIEASEERLSAARQVAPLVPLMETAEGADRRVEEDRRRAHAASDELGRVRGQQEEAKQELDVARRRADELPALEESIRALDEVKGLLAPLKSAEGRKREAQERQRELEHKIHSVEEEKKKARARRERLEHGIEAVSGKLEGLGYDEEWDKRLDGARDAATGLAALRKTAHQAQAETKEAGQRVSREKGLVADRKAAVDRSRKSNRELRRAREKAEADRRTAEQEHAAAHLRGQLEVGKECPVCEQPVAELPPPIQVALLNMTASRLDDARDAEDRARSLLEEENKAAAEAEAGLKATESEFRKIGKKAEELLKAVERSESEIHRSVGDRVASEKGASLEERILSAVGRMAKERERYRQAVKKRDEVEKELLKARGEADRLSQESRALEQQADQVVSRMREADQELAELQERIAKVTTEPDPAKERARLAKRKLEIERATKEAEEAERKTAAAFSSAQKALEELERTAQDSTRAALEAQKKLQTAIRSAGFKEEKVARQAALPPEEVERIEQDIATYRKERHAAEQRSAELESDLGGELVSEQEQQRAEEELAERRRDYETALGKKAELESELKELERRIERASQLWEQKKAWDGELATYKRLSGDLRSEHFQAYLLEEAFRELVTGASVRLENLSGRYTLEYQQDAFHVLDHDNARERRSADTLSGGETFLASLALALELSEQVQRAAGAVNLDSLFIDEGFGTLDPETLDTVAAAIESLHVGGRMVGIITHIPELTERLPACIRVEKRAEGSRVLQEVF
jgi:exonuclease SbcC